jgi:hypothetical protein
MVLRETLLRIQPGESEIPGSYLRPRCNLAHLELTYDLVLRLQLYRFDPFSSRLQIAVACSVAQSHRDGLGSPLSRGRPPQLVT